MKIAYFISNRSTFPPMPDDLQASSFVVENIIKYLKNKHQITVFSAKGSKYKGINVVDLGLPPFKIDSNIQDNDWVTKAVLGMKQIFVGNIFQEADKYDLIHFHTEPAYLGMPMVRLVRTPVIFTLHNTYHDFEKPIYTYYDGKVNLSVLSKDQGASLPLKHKPTVIYNGIETDEFEFVDKDKGYFLFLGRLHEVKGIDDFLEIAKRDKKNTYYIAGKGSELYMNTVKEACKKHKNIKFFGMVARKTKQWKDLISNARALVAPIKWSEPFGLFMPEAMAFGTPVITYSRGSVSEIMEDGKTGFVVGAKSGVPGLRRAIEKINSMPKEKYVQMRSASRERVEKYFDARTMAQNYEDLYIKIINKAKGRK